MTVDPMIGVGVVGTGVMGADHVATLTGSVHGVGVRSVYDVDTDRAASAAEVAGCPIAEAPGVLIADPAVDAVVIASADSTHEELVLGCLAAGKPVLCEKPLAPDVDGAWRIVEAEAATERRLVSVGFMRRYDPGYAELAADLRSGEIGAALLMHCVHRNIAAAPGVPSAKLVLGSGVHEIDTARWLLGEELVEVTAHRPRRTSAASGDTQDPLLLVLRAESGVVISAEVFVNCGYGYEVRCEVVGEIGTITVDEPVHGVRRQDRRRGASVAHDWRDRFAEAYRRELQDWIDGVAVGEQRGASAWDGYVAQAVAEAGVEALESGLSVAPVIPERPALYT